MNLAPLLFSFYILAPLLFFVAVWLLFSSLAPQSPHRKAITRIALITMLLVGIVTGGIALFSYAEGNFLALLLAPIVAVILGGIAGAVVYCALVVLYVVPMTLFYRDGGGIRPVRLIVSALLLGLLALGAYGVSQERMLKMEYGSPSEGAEQPLTTQQIEAAYSNVVFRHHTYLLRGLLFRDNVPSDIIKDIYERFGAKDSNLAIMIFLHANTPCSTLQHALENGLMDTTGNAYTAYQTRCE